VRGDVGEQGIYRSRNALLDGSASGGPVFWTFREPGVERIETYPQPSAAFAALAEDERAALLD
jgi:hypothetical protein